MRLAEHLRLGETNIWHLPETPQWDRFVSKTMLDKILAMSDAEMVDKIVFYRITDNPSGFTRTMMTEILVAIANGTKPAQVWLIRELQTYSRNYVSTAVKSIRNDFFSMGFMTTALVTDLTSENYNPDDFPSIDVKIRGDDAMVKGKIYGFEFISRNNVDMVRAFTKAYLQFFEHMYELDSNNISIPTFRGVYKYGDGLIYLHDKIDSNRKFYPADTNDTLEILSDFQKARNILNPIMITDVIVDVDESDYRIIITGLSDWGDEMSLDQLLSKFQANLDDPEIQKLIINW